MMWAVPRFIDGQLYINSFSKLTHVPREIPSDATKIYLNNNEISDIESGAFAFHFHCINLRLDHNHLTTIRNDTLIGLVALEYLSLEHNAIDYIDPSTFTDLPNLKGLYLHNNKLTTLPVNIFPPKQMAKIQILTLHGNNLKRKELGWLRELCKNEQIQEYTIRNDYIPCTSRASQQIQQQQQQQQQSYENHKSTRNHERQNFANSGYRVRNGE